MLLACATLPPPTWRPALLPLARPVAGQVLLGRAHVPTLAALAAGAARQLPPAEQARAGRYHQAADSLRFVVARLVLRAVLGQCLGVAPGTVPLAAGPTKKLFIPAEPGLQFSLSHTREWVLLALAAAPVGVDVEELNPHFAFAEVLGLSLGPAEQAAVQASPDPAALFYRLWTRKEALVKATGQGLDEQLPRLTALDGQHRVPGPAGATWQVRSFAVAPTYPAALATPAGAGPLAFYELGSAFLRAVLQAG